MSVAALLPFDAHEYRAERNRRLERENEHLRSERVRLERLLADALLVAVGGTSVSPLGAEDVFPAQDAFPVQEGARD